jgi:hypothetical protein
MLHHLKNGIAGRLAMIDSGNTADWTPSAYIRHNLNRTALDYLFMTNADQDHMSDLDGLWKVGLNVGAWHRNPTLSADAFRRIKEQGGPLTSDARRYMHTLATYTAPVTEPFNQYMGGIWSTLFYNSYPQFTNTNDLSLVVFIHFGAFTILFPGDLEEAGWLSLLTNPAFRDELSKTTILVASHHGREIGYCKHVFNFCRPMAIIISDKSIVHATQSMTQTYRNEVIKNYSEGVCVKTTMKRRHVLTTRRDGYIHFEVAANGNFHVTTEYAGWVTRRLAIAQGSKPSVAGFTRRFDLLVVVTVSRRCSTRPLQRKDSKAGRLYKKLNTYSRLSTQIDASAEKAWVISCRLRNMLNQMIVSAMAESAKGSRRPVQFAPSPTVKVPAAPAI